MLNNTEKTPSLSDLSSAERKVSFGNAEMLDVSEGSEEMSGQGSKSTYQHSSSEPSIAKRVSFANVEELGVSEGSQESIGDGSIRSFEHSNSEPSSAKDNQSFGNEEKREVSEGSEGTLGDGSKHILKHSNSEPSSSERKVSFANMENHVVSEGLEETSGDGSKPGLQYSNSEPSSSERKVSFADMENHVVSEGLEETSGDGSKPGLQYSNSTSSYQTSHLPGLVYLESGYSEDDMKSVGVPGEQSFGEPQQEERNEEMINNNLEAKTSSIDNIRVKFSNAAVKVQSHISTDETPSLPAQRKFNGYYPTCNHQNIRQIKEKPSSENAVIMKVSQKIIKIASNHEVTVVSSDEKTNDQDWEVEDGCLIHKFLSPISKTSIKEGNDPKTEVEDESKQDVGYQVSESERMMLNTIRKSSKCLTYMDPIKAAKLIVTSTIFQAREKYRKIVKNYGDPSRWDLIRSGDRLMLPIVTCWPSIGDFTVEAGIKSIEQYIILCHHNSFKENWKYSIILTGSCDDGASDIYFYEAKFSLPNKMYPIPQVSAAIYFYVEVSRVVPIRCPVKVSLRQEGFRSKISSEYCVLSDWLLLRILEMKLDIFKNITY